MFYFLFNSFELIYKLSAIFPFLIYDNYYYKFTYLFVKISLGIAETILDLFRIPLTPVPVKETAFDVIIMLFSGY